MADDGDQRGLSRRDLMRRSAVVGGAMVWATPVVQSMATPAMATGGHHPPPGSPGNPGCPKYYKQLRYKFKEDGNKVTVTSDSLGQSCAWPEYEAAPGGSKTRIDTDSRKTRLYNNQTCMDITFKSSCNCQIKASSVLVQVGKQGPTVLCTSPTNYTVSVNESSRRVTVCMKSGKGKISYVAMLVCCK